MVSAEEQERDKRSHISGVTEFCTRPMLVTMTSIRSLWSQAPILLWTPSLDQITSLSPPASKCKECCQAGAQLNFLNGKGNTYLTSQVCVFSSDSSRAPSSLLQPSGQVCRCWPLFCQRGPASGVHSVCGEQEAPQ